MLASSGIIWLVFYNVYVIIALQVSAIADYSAIVRAIRSCGNRLRAIIAITGTIIRICPKRKTGILIRAGGGIFYGKNIICIASLSRI